MSGNNKTAVRPVTTMPQVTDATIQRMLNVQEQKLSLELKQTEISLRELDHNQKIADKSIEAQAADRKDERLINKSMQLHRLVFYCVVVVLTIGFILTALMMNKDALVLDFVKVILGFAGGYGVSLAVHQKRTGDDSSD